MREFIMGARIVLTDHFSNPLRRARRGTDDLTDSTRNADDRIGDLGDTTRRTGDDVGGLGDRMDQGSRRARAFTAGIGALGAAFAAAAAAAGVFAGAAVVMANDADKALGRLKARTGATAAEAAKLAGAGKEVFRAGWGADIMETTEAVGTLRQNLGELSDAAAAELSKSGFIIQEAFGSEIKESSKVVRTLTANFKDLSQTDAFDLITRGFQEGGDYADDFLDTINEYSVHFAGLGMSADQMFATLIAGGKAGAWNLDKVGDSVKEAFIRLQDGSKTTDDAFTSLGMNADKIAKDIAAGGDSANQAFQATLLALSATTDKLKQETAGVELFGTQWEDMQESVILAMREGQKGMGEFSGATAKAGADLQNNLGDKMGIIGRNIKLAFAGTGDPIIASMKQAADWVIAHMPQITVGIQEVAKDVTAAFKMAAAAARFIGETITTYAMPSLVWLKDNILPALINDLKMFGGWIKSTANFFKENWGTIKPFVEGIVLAFAGFAIVHATILTVTKITKLWTIAQAALNFVLSANPIGLVILGIGLLVGAGIYLVKNWDSIRAKGSEVFASMTKYAADFFEPLMSFIDDAINKFNGFVDKMKNAKFGLPKILGGNGLIQTDGSHSTGLGRVPFDGYLAELHEGERVLTASQAARYDGAKGAVSQPTAARTQQINVEKLIDKVELHAQPGQDGKQLYDEFIDQLYSRAKEAAAVLSVADRGELL